MTDRRIRSAADLDTLNFDERGLVPMVAQDDAGARVLMVAWANRDALARTVETGEVHFWSRSRSEIWRKGETSGNVLQLLALYADCDGDTVLALVRPSGPACHTGDVSCFGDGATPTAAGTLHLLRKIIDPATGLEVRACNTEAAKRKQQETISAQREAIGNALAPMNLQLCAVMGVATVPEIVGAAVRARRDAL